MLLSLPETTTIYKKLALTVLHEKEGIIRACAIWCVLRDEGTGNFYFKDVLQTIKAKCRVDEITVRRWLNAGKGKFWDIQNKKIYLYGKLRVFRIFGIGFKDNPAEIAEINLILNQSIQVVRATFHFAWIDEPRKKACHKTIEENMTGTKKNTQINYQKRLKIKIRHSTYIDTDGTVKWCSNKYSCLNWRKFLGKPNNNSRFGWRTQESNHLGDGQETDNLKDCKKGKNPTKMYYDDIETAKKILAKRVKYGFTTPVFGLLKPKKGEKWLDRYIKFDHAPGF